jgi:bifunctional DNA-binding transcriptional regulator/antitoxin component of YhaV-PrlF toxin-antitoxin module
MKNTTLRVGPRGTVTLPKLLRERYALDTHDLLLAESTPEGILLRPAIATPIEIYTDERIAEFAESERELEERMKKEPRLRKWIEEGNRRFAAKLRKRQKESAATVTHA